MEIPKPGFKSFKLYIVYLLIVNDWLTDSAFNGNYVADTLHSAYGQQKMSVISFITTACSVTQKVTLHN